MRFLGTQSYAQPEPLAPPPLPSLQLVGLRQSLVRIKSVERHLTAADDGDQEQDHRRPRRMGDVERLPVTAGHGLPCRRGAPACRRAVLKIKIYKGLVRDADLIRKRLEVSKCIDIKTDRYLLLKPLCVRISSSLGEVVGLSHD